jgi:hypothetical protein
MVKPVVIALLGTIVVSGSAFAQSQAEYYNELNQRAYEDSYNTRRQQEHSDSLRALQHSREPQSWADTPYAPLVIPAYRDAPISTPVPSLGGFLAPYGDR